MGAELIAVFGAGLASAASPCLLPLYPGFIAYLGANSAALSGRRATGLLGFLVLGGVLSTMLFVGIVLLGLSIPVGLVATYLIPIIDAFLIILGLLLITGRNPFQRLPGVRVPVVNNPYGQAYVYGILLGPLALPCAGPFLVTLLAISVGAVDAAGKVGLFLVFGLGFGLPLVLLSLLAGARQQTIVRFIVANHRAIEIGAGLILIAVALWDLRENWESIRFTLGL